MHPVSFQFRVCSKAHCIEIHFAANQIFYSCKNGSDLNDFETLLLYCFVDLNIENLTAFSMRRWERKLYRQLACCKQQRTALQAFKTFCGAFQQTMSAKGLLPISPRCSPSLIIK